MDGKGWAAILTSMQSAGVAPEVNLRITRARKFATRKLTAKGQRLVSEDPNPLKNPNSLFLGDGGGVKCDKFPTFNAESKSAQIQNSIFPEGWGGGGGGVN